MSDVPPGGIPFPEAALRTLIGASEDAVYIIDTAGTVVTWNPAAERLYGWTAEELLGQALPEAVADGGATLVQAALAGGALAGQEIEIRRRDGLPASVLINAAPVRDGAGAVTLAVVVARETTEQRLAQEALAESAARLSEAQQLARVGLWLWDVASDTLQLSDELYSICGIDPFDFEGTLEAYLALVHPEHRDRVRSDLREAVADGLQYHDEYPLVRPAGETVWVEARGDPVVDSAGRALGLRGICQDLTERRQVEERLREAVEQLQEADRLKDEFLAIVSHELRTPLAAIVGFSLALRELNRDNPDQLDIALRMSGNAEEMRRMVDRILDFSRLEAGRVEVDPVEVVLAEVVERICFNLTGLLAGHELVIDIDPSVRALADVEGLTRIIGNLVTNAVKFSPAATPVVIGAETTGDEVVVSVRDEGVGIPRDLQARVFERFFQAPDQPVGKRGTGVGLSIASRYVDLHGGRIWVESEPGAGATFRFTLRARPTTTG